VPFRHRFAPPIEGILTPEDALERLTDVCKSEDKVALQTILDIASVVGLPSEASTVLGFLLRQTWHRSHRDIAVLLKLFNDPRTIEDLKEAAANPLWYSDCSSFCVYILSQIGSKEAVHAIEDLAVSPNGRVRGDAIRTLMKLRNPGEPE
jgi:HEAT repeat protein